MTDTPKLGLTYLEAAQAQKHVGVNDALRRLDGVVQAGVIDKDLSAPPVGPATGDAYIVGAAPSGLWAGQADNLAIWHDTAWFFYAPSAGWIVYVEDEDAFYKYTGASWSVFGAVTTTSGGATRGYAIEETVTLSGAAVSTTIAFPDRSVVLGASVFVKTTITGAASYDCGYSGSVGAFGGALGLPAGSSNVGVVGPFAVYADEVVTLTANGGNFTGGEVKVVLHYFELTGPT